MGPRGTIRIHRFHMSFIRNSRAVARDYYLKHFLPNTKISDISLLIESPKSPVTGSVHDDTTN